MPRKKNSYDECQLQKVLGEVRAGKISKKSAAKIYSIPRSTIQFRLGPKFTKIRPGPSTVLTEAEELAIVDWVKVSQRKGFPKRKEDILHAVKDFLEENNRDHPFGEENLPGKGWFHSFLKRHPSITLRVPDPVSSASANVAVTDIFKWFDSIENYLLENDYFSILSDPSRIFNGDETNFMLCPKTKSVLAAKGSKNIYEVDRGLAKSNLTVMFSFSASGIMTPPMIIYPYKRVREEIRSTVPDTWGYGISENGWMTKQTFYEYISKVFYPHLRDNKIKFPIIYFVDGHSTHLTLQVSQLCVRLGIILIALYANSTRILQPADVAAFKPLKSAWNSSVLEWRRKNPSKNLTRDIFGPLLKEVVEKSVSSDTLRKGFKACGLFPWNKYAINTSKCLGRPSVAHFQNIKNSDDTDAFHECCTILGTEKVAMLETFDNAADIEDRSDDFKTLHKIYTYLKFNKFKRTVEGNVANKCSQTDFPSLSSEGITGIDIANINEFVYCDQVIENINDVENITILNGHESTGIPQLGQISVTQTYTVINDKIDWPSENILTVDGNMDIPEKIQKDFEFVTPSCTKLNPTTQAYTPMEDILDWPQTPLRKGSKVQKNKKSFVITNSLWIEDEERRKEDKRKIEYLKEERKAERIKKKALKENGKITKKKSEGDIKNQTKNPKQYCKTFANSQKDTRTNAHSNIRCFSVITILFTNKKCSGNSKRIQSTTSCAKTFFARKKFGWTRNKFRMSWENVL